MAGTDEVVIRMVAAGICRTGLEATLGHENVGRIVELGANTQDLELGAMVAVTPG
ncbi:alcohol dehydrogenase catalytic domain-containing protein [Nocardia sp. NPDC052278]|uniref:alcohol dehydrogenase catalytic domain-containing protein n=1 Tax=unclassified Nocardia TaxID=2637762 RepID=UPI0036B7C0EB